MRSIKGKVHGVSDWDINEAARAHVSAEGIVITLDDGRHVDLAWASLKLGQNYLYDSMATVEGVSTEGRTIRFTADSPDFGKQLVAFGPSHLLPSVAAVSGATSVARKRHQTYLGIAVFLVALALSSFNWLPYVVAAWIPPSWEEQMGQSGLAQVAQGEVQDGPAYDAVHKVWDRVQTGLQPNSYHWNIHVVQSSVVNAFAMPGGTVVVYTGLLKQVETPEELAGILGHESQHVIQKHSVKALVRSAEWQVVAAVILGHSGEEMRKLGSEIDGLAYSRGNEAQADREGAAVLLRAHIDPSHFPDFFRRMETQDPQHRFDFMRDHPSSVNRIEALETLIHDAPPEQFEPIAVDWSQVRKSLDTTP
jgi:Zn-dependent protease with chaperone function